MIKCSDMLHVQTATVRKQAYYTANTPPPLMDDGGRPRSGTCLKCRCTHATVCLVSNTMRRHVIHAESWLHAGHSFDAGGHAMGLLDRCAAQAGASL
jgi:hypothetical protein